MKKPNLPHQTKILDKISQHIEQNTYKRWGIFAEPGLGKTKISLDIALLLKNYGKIKKIQIIIPKSLVATWRQEIAEETNWTEEDYYLTPYSMMSLRRQNIDLSDNTLIIIDESHFLKNVKSNRSKSFIKLLKDKDPYIISLTGTPNPKNILDLWIQCYILKSWYGGIELNYFIFSNIYGLWMQYPQYRKLIGEQNRDQLLKGFQENCFFLKKEDVLDLPPKLYEKRYYELSKEQKKLIRELKEEGVSRIDVTLDYIQSTMHAFFMICSGFVYSKFDKEGEQYLDPEIIFLKENPKLELLSEILKSLECQIIIYCCYHKERIIIEELLKSLEYTYEVRHGMKSAVNNQKALDEFRSGKVQVLLATVQSTHVGLNITNCNTIIYFSNTHDYMHRTQSEDRIHRMGQVNKCTYIDLIGAPYYLPTVRKISNHLVNAPDATLLESLHNKEFNMRSLFDALCK